MNLIDTHCHLYLPDFDEDLEAVMKRAFTAGLRKIYLPAIDTETHQRLIDLTDSQTFNDLKLLPMMGLHPCSVKENFQEELAVVEQYLNSGRKFYAVGEIGLDYYWDTSFKQQQLRAFEDQIKLSIEHNLPIAVHSRNSTTDCIELVSNYKGKAKGIFHCFGGTEEEARQIIELGFYLGIGGVVSYKNTTLREVLKAVGLEQVVLETDAPYLTPVPHRGKRNEPAYCRLVAESIAASLGLSLEEVAQVTSRNADFVFRLNS